MPASPAPKIPGPKDSATEGATPKATGSVPITVRIAALLVMIMAIAFVGLGAVELLNTQPDRAEVGITTGITFLAYAGLLLFAVRGLVQRRSWARGVAVCAALLQIPIAVSFWGPGTGWIAVVALVGSLTIIGLLITPSANSALAARPRFPDEPGR